MSTAGQDFFDSKFFDNQIVYVQDMPMETLQYGLYFTQEDLEGRDPMTPHMINNFTSEILSLRTTGYSKVQHHIQKILWLIQSYCVNGWTNSVKAISLLDNGTYIVHPGANRCVAAKFLGCPALKTMISVHKDQSAYTLLQDGSEVIDNEAQLRQSLVSPNTILFRTEIEEDIFVNNISTNKKRIDFTYEFMGNDAWPTEEEFDAWNNLVWKSFPLKVHNPNNYKLTSQAMNKFCYHRMTDIGTMMQIDNIRNPMSPHHITVEIEKPVRDVFELLFFMNPNYSMAQTTDEKIRVINHAYDGSKEERILTIPDHYV
jgi:hypothetical protein